MHHSHIRLKSKVFTNILTTRMACSTEQLSAIERVAARCIGSKKNTEALGVLLSTTKRWFEEVALGGRDGVAQRCATTWRGGWFVSRLPWFSSHIFRIVRDVCVCFVGQMIESGACSCRITDQRLGCRRAVLFSRLCSQTSAGVWHRARPQQCMKGEHWPAKRVVCVRFVAFLFTFSYRCCSGLAKRRGRPQVPFLQDTH